MTDMRGLFYCDLDEKYKEREQSSGKGLRDKCGPGHQ